MTAPATTTITILGCGSSGGVPRVGYGWGACDPAEPRNRRRRCSILAERRGEGGVTRLLVDTSPDLREQLLDAGVAQLDAVLFTHEHADHTHGIDDLRPLVIHGRRRLDGWMDAATGEALRRRFAYVFETPPGSGYPPLLTERRVEPGRELRVEGAGGPLRVLPFRLIHGDIDALGLRFGDGPTGGLAYTPDVSAIPPESEAFVAGLDTWVIDALRPAPHPSHFHLARALEWVTRARPRRAVLTNLHTDLDFATLARELPPGAQPAHDGMVLEVG